MSKGCDFLHSHSALERGLKFPKRIVCVDAKYKYLFEGGAIPFWHNDMLYYKVSVLSFVQKGGVFKDFLV